VARFLAIDADAGGLFVVSATPKGGGAIAVEQTVALADEAAPLSASTAVALGAKLKDLLRQAGIRPSPVLLCVGRDRVILKDVTYPPSAPADEPAVVRFQALRDLTESPDDVLMDYTPSTREVVAGERRATAVFVRKELVTAARMLCEAAGLTLKAVTPRPFALAASLRHAFSTGAAPAPDDPTATLAVVTVWDGGGEFAVVRGSDITFARTIPAHATQSESALVAEVKRNLAVYGGQNPAAPVQAVYLAEADDPAAGWSGRMRAALAVPVYTFDPVGGHPAADLIPAPLRGRFAGPVGLLAARSASATLPINFTQPRQPRAVASKGRPRVLLAGLAGILMLAMVGVYGYLRIDRASRIKTHKLMEKRDLDKKLEDIEPRLKRLAAADEFAKREVNVLDQIYEVAHMIPDVSKAGVTEFHLNALPPPRAEKGRAGTPAAQPKNVPPPPVASLRLVMRSNTDAAAQKIVDEMKYDKVYVNPLKTTSVGGQGGGQQYVVTANVLHRSHEQYVRYIKAKAHEPAPAAPVPVQPGPVDEIGDNAP
jgi:hypothetical protein